MTSEEQQDAAAGQREDAQAFEGVDREVRERQSQRIGEEGAEEERRQWKKTRDLHEEAKQISEQADARHRNGGEDQDR